MRYHCYATAELQDLLETYRSWAQFIPFPFVLCCEIKAEEKLERVKKACRFSLASQTLRVEFNAKKRPVLNEETIKLSPGTENCLCLYQTFAAYKLNAEVIFNFGN